MLSDDEYNLALKSHRLAKEVGKKMAELGIHDDSQCWGLSSDLFDEAVKTILRKKNPNCEVFIRHAGEDGLIEVFTKDGKEIGQVITDTAMICIIAEHNKDGAYTYGDLANASVCVL